MAVIKALLTRFLPGLSNDVVMFVGFLCALAFIIVGALLVYVIFGRTQSGFAKCGRCGRQIACPYCQEDDEANPTDEVPV